MRTTDHGSQTTGLAHVARRLALVALAALLVGGCAPDVDPSPDAPPSLREAFDGAFLVGSAVNARMVAGEDSLAGPILDAQFNSVTPENVMKWESIHPEPDVYDFDAADALVEFAETRGMAVVGHTLIWHSQTPAWVFEHADGTPLSREELLARMEDHISTVAGRYRGRVHGWDVVNEALEADGSLRDSPWRRIIGDDYVEHAFRFAHEADPEAELYYNDYALVEPPKRAGAVRLIRQLREAGATVSGIGIQGHFAMDWPTPSKLDSTIRDLAPLADVMVTELDVSVLPTPLAAYTADISEREAASPEYDPYTGGLPDSVQTQFAQRYHDLFRVFWQHRESMSRVTFWGVTDGDSWRNNWPIEGRTEYPLLFDREGQPKTAYQAVLDVAGE